MKFSDLDSKMRVFETSTDHRVLPGMYIVARLDGRNFTRLTKETLDLEKPFDPHFRSTMTGVAMRLMTESGFNITYGYTQSDEISLLFDLNDDTFNRKERKINSILAGEASSLFTSDPYISLAEVRGAFDCRVVQLPSWEHVVDYFSWRMADSERNALNSYVYWTLRKEYDSGHAAHSIMNQWNNENKHDFLHRNGINFNDKPAWEKRGVGVYWEWEMHTGYNPVEDRKEMSPKKHLYVEKELPHSQKYRDKLKKMVYSKDFYLERWAKDGGA